MQYAIRVIVAIFASIILCTTSHACFPGNSEENILKKFSPIVSDAIVYIKIPKKIGSNQCTYEGHATGFYVKQKLILSAAHPFLDWYYEIDAQPELKSKCPIKIYREGSVQLDVKRDAKVVYFDDVNDIAGLEVVDTVANESLPLCNRPGGLSNFKGRKLIAFGFPGASEDWKHDCVSIRGVAVHDRSLLGVKSGFTNGMSGGPVVNSQGRVIGLVHGGSKTRELLRDVTPINAAKAFYKDRDIADQCQREGYDIEIDDEKFSDQFAGWIIRLHVSLIDHVIENGKVSRIYRQYYVLRNNSKRNLTRIVFGDYRVKKLKLFNMRVWRPDQMYSSRSNIDKILNRDLYASLKISERYHLLKESADSLFANGGTAIGRLSYGGDENGKLTARVPEWGVGKLVAENTTFRIDSLGDHVEPGEEILITRHAKTWGIPIEEYSETTDHLGTLLSYPARASYLGVRVLGFEDPIDQSLTGQWVDIGDGQEDSEFASANLEGDSQQVVVSHKLLPQHTKQRLNWFWANLE